MKYYYECKKTLFEGASALLSKNMSTAVSEEELAEGMTDKYGVIYSKEMSSGIQISTIE